MKNNKGIILSTYIYILLVFFILILSTMLMVLNNTKVISTKIKNSANSSSLKGDLFSIVLVGGDAYIVKGNTYVDEGYIAQTTGGATLSAVVTSNVNTSVVGSYTYKYVVNYEGLSKSVTRKVNVVEGVYNYSYTGAAQTFVVPTSGYYLVELWGGEGGQGNVTLPGKGGYISGQIYLKENEKLYVYVGGAGSAALANSTFKAGGYNGGASANYSAGTGGGATDIRYFGSYTPSETELLWDSALGLNSRIMVAAGGGGSGVFNTNEIGGAGGGLLGVDGGDNNSTYPEGGHGGTQKSGGTLGGTSATSGAVGTFGSGGKGGYVTSYTQGSGAGGGGYYGGAGGSGRNGGGAGGSSFISGYAGVNSMISGSIINPSNNTNHYSGKYFINGQMVTGANSGNGKATITYYGVSPPARMQLNEVRYVKDCINGSTANTTNHWVEIQAIYQGDNVALNKTATGTSAENATYPYSRITDGDITTENYAAASGTGLQCITVDLGQLYSLDEVAVWHYWLATRTYKENTTYVSSNNSTWIPVISSYEAETSAGKRVNSGSYRLFNMVSNSSFENTGWSGGAYNTTYKKYGSYSYALTGTTSTLEVITPTAAVLPTTLDNTHIYYARVEGYQTTKAGSAIQIYWPAAAPNFGTLSLENASSWNMYSFIANKTTFTKGTYQFRIDFDNVNVAGVIYLDGAMLIDLTTAFGPGKEPTKEWCDENIPYFDSLYNLYLPY